jgi:uncharacterized membrane protein
MPFSAVDRECLILLVTSKTCCLFVALKDFLSSEVVSPIPRIHIDLASSHTFHILNARIAELIIQRVKPRLTDCTLPIGRLFSYLTLSKVHEEFLIYFQIVIELDLREYNCLRDKLELLSL